MVWKKGSKESWHGMCVFGLNLMIFTVNWFWKWKNPKSREPIPEKMASSNILHTKPLKNRSKLKSYPEKVSSTLDGKMGAAGYK